MHWDWVRYELCPAGGGSEEPPTMAEQVARMQAEAAGLEAPRPIAAWLERRLERVAEEPDPGRQATELYEIGRHLFVLRRAGVVSGEAGRLEALLDFGRYSLAPEAERREGYLGRVEILEALVKAEGFYPGAEEAHLRLFVSLSPAAIHALMLPGRRYGLLGRTGAVRVATGEVVHLGKALVPLGRVVSLGPVSRVEEVDVRWDGSLDGGGLAEAGQRYLLDAAVELVELDAAGERVVGVVDQAGAWMGTGRLPTRPRGELWVWGRQAAVAAPRAEGWGFELWPGAETEVFVTTHHEASKVVDPVLHVLDGRTGALLGSADDCPEGMPGWVEQEIGGRIYRWYGQVRCEGHGGEAIACPELRFGSNACLVARVPASTGVRWLHLLFHAFANGKGGRVGASVWTRTFRLNLSPPGLVITYRKRQEREELSAGGLFVRFQAEAMDGEELEAFALSPERAVALGPGVRPSGRPITAYLMASHTTLAEGVRPAEGLAGGARVGPMPASQERLFLVGSSDAAEASGKRFGLQLYLNDAGTALERDQDGLGELLEAELGTDPDHPDTDRDGLWDGFEVLGIRVPADLQHLYPEQALPSWGADPRHKDVFVENDVFCANPEIPATCRAAFRPEAIALANEAARTCPGGPEYLDNPDGRPGFSIHVDNGIPSETSSQHGAWGGASRLLGSGHIPDAEWSVDAHFNPIRRGIFRYGASSNDSNAWVGQPTFEVKFASRTGLIHELGHTLGAHHWGKSEPGSNHNYKPHYVSLMNYAYDDGSPSSVYGVGDSRRHHDPSNLRFSLGQYRQALDAAGNLVDFALDPADLQEGLAFPMWSGLGSNTLVDLEGAPTYFRGLEVSVAGQPAVRVDWDQSGTLDEGLAEGRVAREMTSELSLFTVRGTEPFRYRAYEDEPVRFGPQMAARGERLYLFSVPAGSDAIRFRAWEEPPGCHPEDSTLADYCGVEVEAGELPGTGIGSELSAVSAPEGAAGAAIFLFYQGPGESLCALRLGAAGWEGPECRAHGVAGAPEAVLYQGRLVVFVPGPPDAQEMREIRAVVLDPAAFRDPGEPWAELVVLVDSVAGAEPMRSRHTPGFSVDPGDGSLVGIVVGRDGVMNAVVGAPAMQGSISLVLTALDLDAAWLLHPRTDTPQPRWSDSRPAVLAERTASGQPRWTVWAYEAPHGALAGEHYRRHTTTREGESCLLDPTQCRTAFTRDWRIIGPLRDSGAPAGWLFSIEKRNATLALWNGKPRAAVAYDDWRRQPGHHFEPFHEPGFIFFPLGDGVTHKALRDVNDCETFRLVMPFSLTKLGKRRFFHGMLDAHMQRIEAENRVRLPSAVREVEPFFLCPGCPPMPFLASCGGGGEP
jgi:hypothetical protein